MKQNTILLVILVALVTGAASFFAGMKYQQSRRNTFFTQTGAGRGMMGPANRNGLRGFRPVNGEIIKADESSITVKLPDGSSKIVLVSASTTINKAENADKASLKEGETVAVFGTENSDGSVTANTIQLNPMMRVQAQ